MMSQEDLFLNTQQTPVAKSAAPSTPSMTPTRSVKRRSCFANRQSNVYSPTMNVPKREAVSCFSKTQPVCNEDFYDLRTRQVPLYNGIGEVWAQYGIKESIREISPGNSRQELQENLLKHEKSAEGHGSPRKQLLKCPDVLMLLCLMVMSAFLGALCYAYTQDHFLNSYSSPSQKTQDVEVDRSRSVDLQTQTQVGQLKNALLSISEEIKYLKDHFSKLQENAGGELISNPQKGILEELLTADLACSGNLGSVLATPGTTTVTVPATITLLGLFSFDVRMNHKPPRTTLEGLIQEVGDCWPFEGSQGRLVLKLHRRSLLTGVSVSHIPPSLSATGDISSAPRYFQVLVHRQEDDLENGEILGGYEYVLPGAWRQTFPIKNLNAKDDLVDIIEFRFLKNHGNPNYTCVYRVHVHGKTH